MIRIGVRREKDRNGAQLALMSHGTEIDLMTKTRQGLTPVGISLLRNQDGALKATAKDGRTPETSDMMLPRRHEVGLRMTRINGATAIKSTGTCKTELPEPLRFW